jgi:hypothetical protein
LIVASTRNDSSNVLRPVVWGLICVGLVRATVLLVGRRSGRVLRSSVPEQGRA